MTINQQRREHLRKQAAYEMEWRRRIFVALRRQKAPLINYAKGNLLFMAYVDAGLLPSLLNQYITDDAIVSVMERMYRSIVPEEAEIAYRGYLNQKSGRMGFSHAWIDSLDEWLKSFLYDLISNMTEYTKRIIINQINEGVANGDSYDRIIERITATGIDKVRAANIARTEANRAMGWAKWDAAGKLPYPVELRWIAARDKRTRGADADDKADHFHLNGMRTKFGTPFVDPRTGANMNFPGDVSMGAGAGDVCNCRCTVATKRIGSGYE